MFHFPGCPLLRLWIHLRVTALSSGRVSPFGNPWIYACLRLPKAFRSLLRPSSAIGAMASALCSFLLDLSPFDSFLSRTALRPGTSVEPVPVFRTGYSQISLSIRLSLCSFQGALKARFPDPSKRYSVSIKCQSVSFAALHCCGFRHSLFSASQHLPMS